MLKPLKNPRKMKKGDKILGYAIIALFEVYVFLGVSLSRIGSLRITKHRFQKC